MYRKEVMAFQSVKSPNFGNFEIPKFLRQNDVAPWLITKNTIKGKVVASPESGSW
jgi:hypothetical protein